MSKSKKNPAIDTEEEYKQEVFESLKDEQKITNKGKRQEANEFTNKWNMNNRIIKLFEGNIKQDQELRNNYALILIIILSIELIALLIIFILTGLGVLNYSDTTFNIFVTGGIAEIFVLVRVIVQYLFKDNLTEALKIILTMNNNKTNDNKENNKTTDKP